MIIRTAITALVLFLLGCASAPRSDGLHEASFEAHAIPKVRAATRIVIAEIAHSMSVVRVTDEGNVLTEGWVGVCAREVTCAGTIGYQGNPGSRVTPWATIEVRFRALATGTAAEVEIAFEDCDPDVDCQPELLGSTGALERRILEGIRERLDSPAEDPLLEL